MYVLYIILVGLFEIFHVHTYVAMRLFHKKCYLECSVVKLLKKKHTNRLALKHFPTSSRASLNLKKGSRKSGKRKNTLEKEPRRDRNKLKGFVLNCYYTF